MSDINKAIKLAHQNPKLAQLLMPLIQAYVEQENRLQELEMRVASESRAQKKTRAQKGYRQMVRKKSRNKKKNERLHKKFEGKEWKLPYMQLPPKAKEMWSQQLFEWEKRGKVPKFNKPYKNLTKEEQSELREKFMKQSYSEWAPKSEGEKGGKSPTDNIPKKTLDEIASVSDNALNDAYGYGLSKPNTFGHEANKNSAAFALEAIKSGEKDLEAISEAVHKGWANAFNSFDDPIYKEKPEKKKARKTLADTSYSDLSEEEKEKDRVVARAIMSWHKKKTPPKRVDLSGKDLTGKSFKGEDLRKANLSDTDLSKADLSEADLEQAQLQDSDLNEANLSKANLQDAEITQADLFDADFSEANLKEANFWRSRLIGANLSGANLSGANLKEADLSKADLRGADLSETDFTDAKLSGAIFDKKTKFPSSLTPEQVKSMKFSS